MRKRDGNFVFFFFFVHRIGGRTEMSKNNSSFVCFFFFFRRKEERAELSSLSSRLNEKLGEIKKIVGSVRLFENMVKNKKEKKIFSAVPRGSIETD